MVYLVDTENIGRTWLKLLQDCSAEDEILLFYTHQSMPYSLDIIEQIKNAECPLEFIPCVAGHNALDFQLVADLSLRVANKPLAKYAVVSCDKGFDVAIDYLKKKGYDIHRMSFLPHEEQKSKGAQHKGDSKTKSANELANDKYAAYLKGHISEALIPKVASILRKAECKKVKERKNYVYQHLIKAFGNQQGLSLYKIAKKWIKS